MREVLSNDEHCIEVLMCFQCACKELAHYGYNKFGHGMQKGAICYRDNKKAILDIIAGESDDAVEKAWDSNMSAKRYKDHFGKAVASDPDMDGNHSSGSGMSDGEEELLESCAAPKT